jgi:hypothetical protein
MMPTIEQYVTAKTDDKKLQRRILADVSRAGVCVTADSVENFKKHIDGLLAKMNMKRAPIEGRVPTPYVAELGAHDRKVMDGVDPIDGKKLEAVELPMGRKAMYNPFTRAVWPLPVTKNAASVA